MKAAFDPVTMNWYIEITQQEFEILNADWRQNVENRPDFSRMSLEQLLAYRWPEKDPKIVPLEEQAIALAKELRMSIRRRDPNPSMSLCGIEARVARPDLLTGTVD